MRGRRSRDVGVGRPSRSYSLKIQMTAATTISERNMPSHQRTSVLTAQHPLFGTVTGESSKH